MTRLLLPRRHRTRRAGRRPALIAGAVAVAALLAGVAYVLHRRGNRADGLAEGIDPEPEPPAGGEENPEPSAGAGEKAIRPHAYEEFQRGLELLQSGNPAQAVVRLEKARYFEPYKSSIREALGRAYYELGRLEKAEREFKTVVEKCPTNDYAHFCLSRVLGKRGRYVEAGAHLRLAQAMNPERDAYGVDSG